MSRIFFFVSRFGLLVGLLVGLPACETDLDAAYDEFRDQAPPVCKDYCEEKVACERPTGGGSADDDVFTAQMHRCVVECASYAVEGAYIWTTDSTGLSDRLYNTHLDGEMVMDAFDCLYDMGAYRCVDLPGGYVHQLNPPTRLICEESNQCIASFSTNYYYSWAARPDGFGGSCSGGGTEFIESIFF